MPLCCEEFQCIDVRKINFRIGALWQYPEPDGIAVSVDSEVVRVIHRNADFHVRVTHTHCNYGRSRPWLLCPRCERRCAFLYNGTDGYAFGCRRCLRLIYTCQTEDTFDRLLRRGRKLEGKIGGGNEKPKWMRVETFERICWNRIVAERDAVLWLTRRLAR